MTYYRAIAHILWELPFPLRLLPTPFWVWEPSEGVALFDPRSDVGELAWKRKSSFLQAGEVFEHFGIDPNCYPSRNYFVTSKLSSGKEIGTAHITGGREGGFAEARPYTVANIFLCLRHRDEYSSDTVLKRAGDALNNILEIDRFLTMDPLVRPIDADSDCYYTLVSVADVPKDQQKNDPKALLAMSDRLPFGSVIGESRAHYIGLNSYDDLISDRAISKEILRHFISMVLIPHALELFHQLILSAIRRLKRNENAMAVLDAQSAFESLVAVLVYESLIKQGKSTDQIESEMDQGGPLHTLQRRLEALDRIAVQQTAGGVESRRFLGSTQEALWRRVLYRLRNRIIHEGVRIVSFENAKEAIRAGLHAIYVIQDMVPEFNRKLIWSGDTLELMHIRQSAGRLSRLFEN